MLLRPPTSQGEQEPAIGDGDKRLRLSWFSFFTACKPPGTMFFYFFFKNVVRPELLRQLCCNKYFGQQPDTQKPCRGPAFQGTNDGPLHVISSEYYSCSLTMRHNPTFPQNYLFDEQALKSLRPSAVSHNPRPADEEATPLR